MYSQEQLKEIVEKAIAGISYNDEAARLIDPVKYVLSIGGKRLRPVLTLMACNLFSDKIDDAVKPAAGIEVFHNFTLVHDDIMDNAPVRRNLPTVHRKWNLNQAILSGDVMAFVANECFLQTPAGCLAKVFIIFNRAAIEVCVGQQLDMDYEKAVTISQQEYMRMIALKTAALIAASARIGAVIGGASDRDAEMLYTFGRDIGMAFQLQDDLLDVYGDSKVFGKIRGGDIAANKKTFLYVKAAEKASAAQLKRLHELFSTPDTDPEQKVKQVIEIYDQLKIREQTESIVGDYIEKAFTSLENAGGGEERKGELNMLAETLVGREK